MESFTGPPCKRLRTVEAGHSLASEDSDSDVDQGSDVDSSASTVASAESLLCDWLERPRSWWVLGAEGPYAFFMLLEEADELELVDYCLLSLESLPLGWALEPEPILLRALEHERLWLDSGTT